MTVPPMGAGDPVAIKQMDAVAHSYGFVAYILMNETRDLAGRKFEVQTLLELPNSLHRTESGGHLDSSARLMIPSRVDSLCHA